MYLAFVVLVYTDNILIIILDEHNSKTKLLKLSHLVDSYVVSSTIKEIHTIDDMTINNGNWRHCIVAADTHKTHTSCAGDGSTL